MALTQVLASAILHPNFRALPSDIIYLIKCLLSAPGGECGVISIALMPQPYPSTVNKPWWSYDIGTIHMMGMSTEHDFRVGSDQYKW